MTVRPLGRRIMASALPRSIDRRACIALVARAKIGAPAGWFAVDCIRSVPSYDDAPGDTTTPAGNRLSNNKQCHRPGKQINPAQQHRRCRRQLAAGPGAEARSSTARATAWYQACSSKRRRAGRRTLGPVACRCERHCRRRCRDGSRYISTQG
ncbi:hypothetical protein ACPA9J_27145 [Pseudomonas aeruginosa]